MLETTTIDSGMAHAGAILAKQIAIPDGMVRDMVIEERFGGFPHRFRLDLAPSGAYAPTPVDIPALPCAPAIRVTGYRRATPSPAIFKSMPIVE